MRIVKVALLAALLFVMKNAEAATLSVSPTSVAQGNPVTATFAAIAAPTNRDWIGFYSPGVPDVGGYIDWFYTNSCTKSGNNSVLANGQCNYSIPSALANGTYEMRLFSNNGYTRLAISNSFNVAPVPPARFVNNNNGTITDKQTGLVWEEKAGLVAGGISCATPTTCPDPHQVNNVYTWTTSLTIADGTLFSDYLSRLNRADGVSSDGLTQNRLNYSDWRIPNVAELRSLLLSSCPGGSVACLDPIFGAAQPASYWTSTTSSAGANNSQFAWVVNFGTGAVEEGFKSNGFFVRAVRGGR